MTRWKASGIHFSISLMIGIFAFCVLYFVYYPQPYFEPAGASKLVLILLGVDVVLGPLLTSVVFKSGKKSLKLDLSVIAAVQMAALLYGLHIMWAARPVFVVASVDRFELVYSGDITDKAFAAATFPEFLKESVTGPVLAIVRQPKPEERAEVMDIIQAGSDVHMHPRFFVPATPAALATFWARAKQIKALPENARKILEAYIKAQGLNGKFVAVPLKGRVEQYTVLVDQDANKMIAAFEVSAWD
jgi:hypothetical protein